MKKPIILLSLLFSLMLVVIQFSHAYAQSPTPDPDLSPAATITPGGPVPTAIINTPTVPGGFLDTAPVPSPVYEACFAGFGYPEDPNNPGTPIYNGPKDKWVYDADITALGKAGDRARQFVYWAVNTKSLDNSAALKMLWSTSRNIMYVLLVIVTILMGIGIIIGQRANFDFKVKIWPLVFKLALLLLYVTFSYTIVLLIIQFSDILMQFFIKNTGGDKLFNVFFSGTNSVDNYKNFRGCVNINPDVKDSVNTSKLLLNITNITYYAVGIAIILRKIVLWFMLLVAPFLALLAPFVFIRNVGWIWIGVFFQWVFYGPLFGLFLGAVAGIWNSPTHIPFQFIFSKANTIGSVVYPTAINILYSGPANKPQILNSSNYDATFAEYVISILMLWVAILLPWLLLRIFRDYCCDGIYAMKNILLSMYDNMKNPPQGPSPSPRNPSTSPAAMDMQFKAQKNIESNIKLETTEEIKRTKTEDIKSSMNLSATKLTDIAHYETNSQTRQMTNRNLEYLQNPMKAENATDRQKFMNVRTELFDRATKGDVVARQTLAALSSSKIEQTSQKQTILETMPQAVPVIKTTSIKVGLPQDKTTSIVTSIFNTITNNSSVVNSIANASQTTSTQTQSVLQSAAAPAHINQAATTIVSEIAKETGVAPEKVKQIISSTSQVFKNQKELTTEIAQKQQVNADVVQKVIDAHIPVIADTQKHIEDTISIPSTVSIEDYEEVKSMWKDQYEKGEIPTTEAIKDRADWVETDVVAITNILNKILSSDPQLKAQGLDEVGYILPIFMINNLKGEELAVYLKAKLEAAKQVKKDLEKETEIKEKLKDQDEELVEVDRKMDKVKEKTLEMSQELPNEQDQKEGMPQTPIDDAHPEAPNQSVQQPGDEKPEEPS
jgi:hypothetical protein